MENSKLLQDVMVLGRNAYLKASTSGWKCWKCLECPHVVGWQRDVARYATGSSTSPLEILYSMDNLEGHTKRQRDSSGTVGQ